MALLHLRGGFLYEHRPDVIPHGYLSDDEIALWCAWFEIKAREDKGRGR